MSIHLFNPPAPNGDPSQPGDSNIGCRRCGSCVSVPKYWRLTTGFSTPLPDLAPYLGTFTLTRIGPLESPDTECGWSIALGFSEFGPIASWELWYGSFTEVSDGLSATGWFVLFNSPPFQMNVFAAYISPNGLPGHRVSHFNCLSPNTLELFSGGVGTPGQWPTEVTVQPYWP